MNHNPATLLDLMCVDVANLLAAARAIPSRVIEVTEEVAKSGDIVNEPTDLLLKAKALDEKLLTWSAMIPSSWVPTSIPAYEIPQNVQDAGLYGDSCHIYQDIMICSAWNDWRVARLKVLGLIARLGSNKTNAEAITAIQILVDDICASIPFTLGSRTKPGPLYEMKIDYPALKGKAMPPEHQRTAGAYGGWYLFAPFKETLNVGMYLREGQLVWLRAQLFRLAEMYDVEPA